MNIIGFNLDQTTYGLHLDNGGACLLMDGEVKTVIQEERINRKQYSPGFAQSIRYVLEANRLEVEDVDLFVASSCLEPRVSIDWVQSRLLASGFRVPRNKIRVCDHHESHAMSAFYPSPFKKALILVADGDGNVLDRHMTAGTDNDQAYWNNFFEHTSYFVGNESTVTLLDRDHVSAGENGLGGAYRYFTYFCGFPGYKYAGKLMGLSAYGAKRNRLKDLKLFRMLSNGQIVCHLPDKDRLYSPQVVEHWLQERGVCIRSRRPYEPISEEIEDVAYFVQRELTEILVEKISYLVKKTGVEYLCVAGGVGLNAVTNRALLDRAGIKGIYIQPSAGDSGQCIGNAYYGHRISGSDGDVRCPLSVYQGKEYSDVEIAESILEKQHAFRVTRVENHELFKKTAQAIATGKIVAWFQGRSEIGPRALGNRSILADPRKSHMKNYLNDHVKHREAFRPFAPSVLEEESEKWFDGPRESPYMILNARVLRPNEIPAVTHIDGSARIQTVSVTQNARYHALISAFRDITGVPVLLNTSFNDNEAIVETPKHAIETFLRTEIDILVIGNYLLEKHI